MMDIRYVYMLWEIFARCIFVWIKNDAYPLSMCGGVFLCG